MRNRQTTIIGTVLIIIGAYLILSEYDLIFRFNITWPLIMLVIGAAMVTAYFISKPKFGYLQSGSILLWLGMFFLLRENSVFGYYGYSQSWPGIVIAVGLGLVTAGTLSNKHRQNISNGVLLTGIGITFLILDFSSMREFGISHFTIVVGIIAILIGIKMILDFAFGGKQKA